MDRLVPTSLEQWSLLEYAEPENDLCYDVRCKSCLGEAPIAFYIDHADGCIAATVIKLSIDNLSPDVKAFREEMERYL